MFRTYVAATLAATILGVDRDIQKATCICVDKVLPRLISFVHHKCRILSTLQMPPLRALFYVNVLILQTY